LFLEAYTASIANSIVKFRVLQQRLEQQQFESFMRVRSFIVHDIKNQVSTLSLMSKIAERNMANPEFQKSLLSSLRSCSDNLRELTGRLQSPQDEQGLRITRSNVNEIIARVIDNTSLRSLQQVKLELNTSATAQVDIDERSLFYVVKNIVVNALEAMRHSGALTVQSSDVTAIRTRLHEHFGQSKEFYDRFRVAILVQDSGPGMTREFIEQKLFKPFMTTKDNGIGLGLYQCKSWIERMNGRILCRSVVGEGAMFCILL
jgi:signal transduction histidine kinase